MALKKTVVYLWMSSSSLNLDQDSSPGPPSYPRRVTFQGLPPTRSRNFIPGRMSLREPPPHVRDSYGYMDVVGTIVNIIFFIIDIVSDGLLAYVLWRQAENETDQLISAEAQTWFIITLCIIIVPMVIINMFSLLWYWQNKLCLGDYCVLHKMSKSQIAIRVFLHLLLLGPLIRYLDIMRYGTKMRREMRNVEMGEHGAIMRRTPRGEVHAVLHMVIARDTAMLDMMHSFLQDAPQLIFQIFLLYRSPEIITGTQHITTMTTAVQVWKVLLGVTTISWSLVSYQDQLRHTLPNKPPLSCTARSVCLLWRATMMASRVIAIASFGAILPAGADRTMRFLTIQEETLGKVVIGYPTIMGIGLAVHWLIMTAWIHAQSTTFCANDDDSGRPILELMYNCVMGLVHIFCYINLKDTPSRRRMFFFYTLTLIENSVMVTLFYLEMVTSAPWFRVTLIFTVEALWVVGVCSVIGYYSFLHPEIHIIGRNYASWRQ